MILGDEFVETMRVGSERLQASLIPVAAVLCFAGLIAAAYNTTYGNDQKVMRTLVTLAVIVVVINPSFGFQTWLIKAQGAIKTLAVSVFGADSLNIPGELFDIYSGAEKESSGWSRVWKSVSSPTTTMFQAVSWAVISLVAMIAVLMKYLASILQIVLIYGGCALCPLFAPLILFGWGKQVFVKFMITMAAVTLWPLGWGVADVVTKALMKSAASEGAFREIVTASTFGSTIHIYTLLISIWLLFSTLAAPFIITKAFQSGGNAVGEMLGMGMSAAGGLGSKAVAGAAMVATGGAAAPALAAAGGGIGGAQMGASIGSAGSAGISAIGGQVFQLSSSDSGGGTRGGGSAPDPVARAKAISAAAK